MCKSTTARKRPQRSIAWVGQRLSAGNPTASVRVTCGGSVCTYSVSEFPAPEGRAFTVAKVEPLGQDGYAVFLHANGQDRSCECLGWLRHGHCKHVSGLIALLSR